jgi:hypothetical protein
VGETEAAGGSIEMSLRLALAEIWIPGPIRSRELGRLFALTAEAFDAPLPSLAGLSFDGMVGSYARWTGEQATGILADEIRAAAIRARLRELSLAYGRRLGRLLGLRTRGQVMRAGRLLYRLIGIDFEGTEEGKIVIRRCAFSQFYTPAACALIAGLDDGVISGLSGGGRLEFDGRITEKNDACRARFLFPEGLP